MRSKCFLAALMVLPAWSPLCGQEAQEATSPPAATAVAKPERLTMEARRKLSELRQKVSDDPEYQSLLKAAQAAQARADDFFLAKLRQASAGEEVIARHVAEMIKQHKSARSGEGEASGGQ